ncbi:MAG: F0F1 ATP synthase subunit delta [Pseudomonadota bacterium]
MELNWTTFVLEILNFLVLVWLLKHFLYQPVMGVVRKRQQGIEEQLQQAEAKEREAEALRERYESSLANWESERQSAREKLHQEIEQERQQQLKALQGEMASERERRQVLMQRREQEQWRQSQAQALEQGARFASRLLEAIASPEVEQKLLEHLLAELDELPPAQRDALQSAVESGGSVEVDVLSAYPLSEAQQQQLRQALERRVPRQHLHYEFHSDRKLLAGLRVTVGPWVMHANLHDELKTFAAIAYER